MWIAVLKFFSGSAFGALVDGYKAKLASENTADKIASELAIKDLDLQGRERELNVNQNIADEGRWWTAAPRAIVCWAFAIYVAKVVIWDMCFGFGATPLLKGPIADWAGSVMVMWFGGRTIEKVARIWRAR